MRLPSRARPAGGRPVEPGGGLRPSGDLRDCDCRVPRETETAVCIMCCLLCETVSLVLISSHSINSVNTKKPSNRMFRYIHRVLNEIYLQNFLHRWAVNRETNLTSLLNP